MRRKQRIDMNTTLFEAFANKYQKPKANTGVSLEQLGLGESESLKHFMQEVGGGIFEGGFLSIVSVREQLLSYGGWEYWLPKEARLFASSAFGFLAFTQGEDLWLIDTQYGQVIESDCTLVEFINDLASEEAREMLQAELFNQRLRIGGSLNPEEFLCPVPMIPLGGVWDTISLQPMKNSIYLSLTGQLFQKDGDMPAEVLLLGDETRE